MSDLRSRSSVFSPMKKKVQKGRESVNFNFKHCKYFKTFTVITQSLYLNVFF